MRDIGLAGTRGPSPMPADRAGRSSQQGCADLSRTAGSLSVRLRFDGRRSNGYTSVSLTLPSLYCDDVRRERFVRRVRVVHLLRARARAAANLRSYARRGGAVRCQQVATPTPVNGRAAAVIGPSSGTIVPDHRQRPGSRRTRRGLGGSALDEGRLRAGPRRTARAVNSAPLPDRV